MIHLAQPALLLVGTILLLPYLLRPQRTWQYSWIQLLPTSKLGGLPILVISGVTCSALLLLLVALARPQRTMPHASEARDVRDIVLTLDLSLSMEGFMPSMETEKPYRRKLDLVQRAALDFVRRHPHDRLGLIVFGDDAFGVWPLSTDSTTLQRRLQSLDALLPAELRGTHVEKALVKTLVHFQELGQADTKIALLLTDGLDTIEPAVEARIVRTLQKHKVRLYVLGIQLPDDSSIVRLTRRAQGRYFNINKAEELENALREIEQLEKSRVIVAQGSKEEDIYALFAIPGVFLLLVSVGLKSTWVLEV